MSLYATSSLSEMFHLDSNQFHMQKIIIERFHISPNKEFLACKHLVNSFHKTGYFMSKILLVMVNLKSDTVVSWVDHGKGKAYQIGTIYCRNKDGRDKMSINQKLWNFWISVCGTGWICVFMPKIVHHTCSKFSYWDLILIAKF